MNTRSIAPFLAVAALFISIDDAYAGACPMCMTSADCTAFPGSLCVLWDRDFGCGDQRQTCCPGQNCALDRNGQPSCLGNGCVIVDPPDGGSVPDSGPGADMGSNDSGMSLLDAAGDMDGTALGDAAPNTGDAAAGANDAAARDSTGPSDRERTSDCGCDTAGERARAKSGSGWLAVLLFALILQRTKRTNAGPETPR